LTAEIVDAVFAAFGGNAPSFPAAHADDKIEKSYKIKGYPTKVLVSPDGKMLDLQFGADYASILQAYSNAYFTQEKEQPSTIKIDNKKKD